MQSEALIAIMIRENPDTVREHIMHLNDSGNLLCAMLHGTANSDRPAPGANDLVSQIHCIQVPTISHEIPIPF